MVNKASPIPLYYQIKEDIISQIKYGKYNSGDQIDGEFSLTKKYGVSQITIRKALSELVTEGYLYRIRGKGTFVSSIRHTHTTSLRSFAEEMHDTETKGYETKVIEISEGCRKRINDILGLNEDADTYKIKRVRYAGEEAIGLQVSYISSALVSRSAINEIYEVKSLYAILEKHYRRPRHVNETYKAVIIDNDSTKKLLNAAIGDPAFFVIRRGSDSNYTIFEYTESIFLGSKFELSTEEISSNK